MGVWGCWGEKTGRDGQVKIVFNISFDCILNSQEVVWEVCCKNWEMKKRLLGKGERRVVGRMEEFLGEDASQLKKRKRKKNNLPPQTAVSK